ncbi:hypothetical protein L218DRAFT_967584 [Marasmius fiardii PR-910]|nr:hypothetical protein L218DRAFT_967584 [Marasmius fiardii PR-910]
MGGSSSEIWKLMIGWPIMGAKAQGAVSWGTILRTSRTAPWGPGHPTPQRSHTWLAIGKTETWDMIGDPCQRHQ